MGEGICQLPDSSYLLTGSSGGLHYGSAQLFITKVDKNGHLLWTKNKGGSEGETGRRIFFFNDTVYVLGRTNSFGNSMQDYFLVLDTLGNTIAEKAFGSSNYDWLQDAVFIPKDTTFMLLGFEQANDTFQKWMTLKKIDLQGNIIQQVRKGITIDTKIEKLNLIHDTVLVAIGNQFNTTRQFYDGAIRFYDIGGNPTDSIFYYSDILKDFTFTEAISSTENNSMLITSGYAYLSSIDTTAIRHIINTYSITDRTFTQKEQAEITDISMVNFIAKMPNSPYNYLLIKRAKRSNFGIINDGYWDELIYQYKGGNTNFFWVGSIVNVSSNGDDISNQVIPTLDNGLIIIGYDEGFNHQSRSVTLVKITNTFDAVPNYSVPSSESLVSVQPQNTNHPLTVFPNPVANQLKINTPVQVEEIQIYSISGTLMMATQEKTIDVSKLRQGIYLLRLTTNTGQMTATFVKN